ncbi:hypothetical protein DPMN_133039 [Dreissena polymorpha]|uniref:Uncharacterized protein n=1 Tax=Dreissena polymorpha TaxID=45954 RepID=A0A9D4FXR3_DREPO|nr:hypothetical protein DPMN_133039 [Dreissena polymorpha]
MTIEAWKVGNVALVASFDLLYVKHVHPRMRSVFASFVFAIVIHRLSSQSSKLRNKSFADSECRV